MKRLLPLLLFIVALQFCFSQAPTNDTVENATELTTLNYFESDIRLDLAAVNQNSPDGCNTNGFSGVYYKFIATENTTVNASILSSSAIISSFVIAYSAPNLNITSTSELNLQPGSNCAFGTQTSFDIVTGQSYYIMVHRSDANALTSFSFTGPQDVPESERTALINFYNAMGGDNWINNTNWNSSNPVSTWFGVFTTSTDLNGQPFADGEEHVYGLNFFEDNNLTGILPTALEDLTKLRNIIIRDGSISGNIPEVVYNLPDMLQIQLFNLGMSGSISPNILNLTNLQVFDVRGNSFSGPLPDFTTLNNMSFLNIQNNNFVFDDFETQFTTYQSTINNFNYAPQANISEDQIEIIEVGDDIILDTNLTSPNNQYLWFYNGSQLIGEEGSSVVLNDIQPQQMGSYFCFVSNTVVTGLSLSTGTYIIGQDPTMSPDYNTLLDLYNSTNGNSWTNNTNWLDPNVPLSGWNGISVLDNDVIVINLGNNNLDGTIPSSITNLNNLESLELRFNNLNSTIPDFSIISSLQYLGLSNNNFDFIDFEVSFANNATIANFFYSPQKPRDFEIVIDATIGNDYSFPMTTIDGTSVDYQWHTISKIDPNDLELVSGQNTNVLDLPNLQSSDMDAYKCIATSPLVPGLEIFRNTIELKGPVSQVERDALIAIYNATNGPNWFNTVNWNTSAPVSTWTGVTTTGNKVTTLNISGYGLIGQLPNDITNLSNLEALYIGLGDTGLTGTIPSNIGDLTELKVFWIQGTGMSGDIPDSFGNLLNLYEIRFLANNFTGILPASISNLTELISVQMTGNEIFGNRSSFSGPIPFNAPNAQIFLQENNFDFGDLEPFVQAGNYVTFGYSPQNTDDLAESIDSGAGVDITLNVNDTNLSRSTNTAINNNYQWYKDNIAITGANAANYTIVNAQIIDSGEYFCEITNPVLPDLTIVRAPITVNIDKELGINESDKNEITLYPNPVQNWLTVNTNNLVDAMLSIYDVKGSLVISKNINGSKNVLNIEALQSGVYIIQINDNVSVLTKRFIKQ